MRYLASTSRSLVSMWMSEARRSMAPSISESTRRTIGLSAGRRVQVQADVRRRRPRAAAAACSLACSSSISPPRWRRRISSTRPAGATTASIGRARRNSASSTCAGRRGRRTRAPAARRLRPAPPARRRSARASRAAAQPKGSRPRHSRRARSRGTGRRCRKRPPVPFGNATSSTDWLLCCPIRRLAFVAGRSLARSASDAATRENVFATQEDARKI